MNIAILTSSFPLRPDDVVQAPFLIPFIEGLQKRGHRISVFTQDREGNKGESLKDIRVTWFPWMGSARPLVHLKPFHPLDGLRLVSLFRQGRKAVVPFLKENRVDACLALWVLPGGYLARYAFIKTQVPYSVWALGSDIYRYGESLFLRSIMAPIIRDARGVFADGYDMARRVEERFQRKCDFLATTRTLRKTGETDRVPLPLSYRFLFVGRLEKVKGVDLLLRSMALLREEGGKAHLMVVGKGSLEPWMKGFIGRKKLESDVTLMGQVSDSTLAQLFESADCVVIPSRSESIPLVFSETLNFDREMIVTDVGDMGGLGREYHAARVIPPEDPEALKEAMMEKIRRDPRGADPRHEEKRADLKRRFDIDVSVDRFLSDYS